MSNAILIADTQSKATVVNRMLILVLVGAVLANGVCLWPYLQ